jgi:Rieske Fe-S protein
VVQWNGAARTWDCPCHGGRYDCYGKVIAAPPKDDLERKELDQSQ